MSNEHEALNTEASDSSKRRLSPGSISILRHFSRLEKIVGTVILILLAAIALTIALGDRVGVTVTQISPAGAARSTSRIVIRFSETMKRDSVVQHFKLESSPGQAISGNFTWSGAVMTFAPSEAMKPGVNYTARLDKGAESDSGRAVLADYQNTFTVRTPRVAYLAPSDSAPQNIWIADPANPSSAQQVTFSTSGIFDFGVSPDGTQIAFAERNNELGTADIKLLNLTTGAIQPLTNCPDSDCTTPVWRPDGQMIAYQRIDFNSGMNIGSSPTRIWLIDLTATPPTTRPLFSDTQILSYEPEWSADGSKISVYDNADQGILVYDFTTDTTLLVSTAAGMAGTISPDGKRLVFPKLTVSAQQGAMTSLQMADLTTGQTSDLTPPSAQVQDEQVAWSPDGKTLAVVRSVTGEGPAGVIYQIYFLNADDGTARPISDNSHYVNGFFSWDPTGQQLALQRFPGFGAAGQINTDDRPSVWTYALQTNTFTEVAKNSFFPRWVP